MSVSDFSTATLSVAQSSMEPSLSQPLAPSNASSSSIVFMPYQLPPLTFHGEAAEWPAFWRVFQVNVHMSELTLQQKYAQLINACKGKAARVFDGLPTSPEAYYDAIDALRRRYGPSEEMAHRLMDQARNLDFPKEYAKRLDTLDHLESIVRRLEEMGVSKERIDASITLAIKAKIPYGWRFSWAKRSRFDPPDVVLFLEFLREQTHCSYHAGYELSSEQPARCARPTQARKRRHEMPSAVALPVAQHASKRRKMMCTFCKGSHTPANCEANLTPKQRWDAVRKIRACFNCGIKGHFAGDCRMSAKCDCGKLHIKLLCPELRRNKDNEPTSATALVAKYESGNLPTVHLKSLRIPGKNGDSLKVLCDSGCSYTLIAPQALKRINHEFVRRARVRFTAFKTTSVANVRIVRVHSPKVTFDAIVSEDLKIKIPDISPCLAKVFANKFGEERNLADRVSTESTPIDILLGEDNLGAFLTGETMQVVKGLQTSNTIYGWVLHGLDPSVDEIPSAKVMISLQEMLSDFWSLEHMGIYENPETEYDLELRVRKEIEHLENGAYQVRWPWKPGSRDLLSDNLQLCKRRLAAMLKKLSPEQLEAYQKALDEWESLGIIEKISPNEARAYIPHRGVIREASETTKLRIVHDGSAKSLGGYSPNDCMEEPPNLLPLLFGILLRFRTKRYAFTGDLRKAFLQILLHPEDRPWSCFLWMRNEQFSVYKFRSIYFGNSASPFLLQVVLKHHFLTDTSSPEFAKEKLLPNTYVDDVCLAVDTVDQVQDAWETAKVIFKRAHFELEKFHSNSEPTTEPHKVLGVKWSTATDELLPVTFNISGFSTKRELVSSLASFYDPLGLVSPLTTKLKVLVQDLCIDKVGWDSPLSDLRVQEAKNFFASVERGTQEVRIPRWIGLADNLVAKLHVFVDASKRMYAAAAYVVVNESESSLLASKARLGTLKRLTIPRMELMAAELGTKLATSVVKELGTMISSDVSFHTDSMCVLGWLRQGPRNKDAFVRNRVMRISDVEGSWSHVPTKENPADLPTRGKTSAELSTCELWWKGPIEYIQGQKEASQASVMFVKTEDERPLNFVSELINPKVSSWKRLVGAVARCLRLAPSNENKGELKPEELEKAQNVVFKNIQAAFFQDELYTIENGLELSQGSRLKAHRPFLKDGLLAAHTRIAFAQGIDDSAKDPVILVDCKVVRLYVRHMHETLLHAPAATVQAFIRSNGIWILRFRKTVQLAVRGCSRCFTFKTVSPSQGMGPFVSGQVNFSRPFAYCGVDYAGPIITKHNEKVYLCLFTCLVVRAVHLELAESLSEKHFLLCMQRFTARRGMPIEMRSDQGRNFVAARNTILRKFPGITWKFNVTHAPWTGGAWERLVGSVKVILRRLLSRGSFDKEQIATFIVSAEAIVNKRPICYLAEDVESPIVTPELFLKPSVTAVSVEEFVRNQESKWSQLRELWVDHYLLNVLAVPRDIWPSTPDAFEINEVVLMRTPGLKQHCWPFARVTKLITGRDGRVRSLGVTTIGPKGRSKESVISVRNVRRLERIVDLPVSNPGECRD